MTYPLKYTFTQINSHLVEMLEGGLIDPDLVYSEQNNILDLTSETTRMIPFRNALRECGIDIDDNLWLANRDNPPLDLMTITIRDEFSIDRTSALTDEIYAEYDAQNPTTSHWATLSLGGDDSVDYCSSYLDALWEILGDLTK